MRGECRLRGFRLSAKRGAERKSKKRDTENKPTQKAFSNAQTKKACAADAGGEMNCDTVVGKATMAKPFVYTAGATGESEQVNIAFKKYGWGDDFKRFYGNAKVEAAAYVYNRKDGKLLGQKFTSKAFADKIEKKIKPDMQNAANENMLK